MYNKSNPKLQERPAASEPALQPLREVGSLEKTQYWSCEDVQEAIRIANQMSIAPETLFGTATGGAALAS